MAGGSYHAAPESVATTGQVLPPHPASVPVAGAASAQASPRRADNIHDLEREHILPTLAEVKGSRRLAVERLGISERTLRYKLAQYREEGYLED